MHTVIETSGESRSRVRDQDDLWSDFQRSLGTLRRRIYGNGASDLVLADLLEDDLRQARVALHTLTDFLDETLETLGTPNASPADVIAASDTSEALKAVDELAELLPSVRRRLGQVALRFTRR